MHLVCIHGNSLDSTIFDSISVDGFEKISLNLPGHGQRELGNVKSFSDFVDVVYQDIAHLKDVVLLGSSLGGHIVHHLLSKMQPLALVTISSPPLNLETVAKAFAPNSVGNLLFQTELSTSEAMTLADSMLSLRKDLVPQLSGLIEATDPQARGIIASSLMKGEFLDEIGLLKGFSGPKILVIPSMDSIINQAYVRSIDYAQVIELEGNHILTRDNPQAINELLRRELKPMVLRHSQ
jgi:pimeloyl-ACP methyl ester carboxylesterase